MKQRAIRQARQAKRELAQLAAEPEYDDSDETGEDESTQPDTTENDDDASA